MKINYKKFANTNRMVCDRDSVLVAPIHFYDTGKRNRCHLTTKNQWFYNEIYHYKNILTIFPLIIYVLMTN